MGVNLERSDNKLAIYDGYAEEAKRLTKDLSTVMEDMRAKAIEANFGVVTKAYNVFAKYTTGARDSGGILSIVASGCRTGTEQCEALANSKSLQPAFKAKVKKTIENLSEAQSTCQAEFSAMAVPEDGQEHWTSEMGSALAGCIQSSIDARKRFITNFSDIYSKNKTEETRAIVGKWAKELEDQCNRFATELAALSTDLAAIGVEVGSMLSSMEAAAGSFASSFTQAPHAGSIMGDDAIV